MVQGGDAGNSWVRNSNSPSGVDPSASSPINGRHDWPKLSGMLRETAKGKGNFGIGEATQEQTIAMGRAWVGPNYRVSSSNPNIWISQDGLRQFRLPVLKPRLNRVQANLEWRLRPAGNWLGNAHIDVLP